MKIAFINHVLILGDGISTVIWNLARCLAKEHEVNIFTFSSGYESEDSVRIQEVRLPFRNNKFVNPGLSPLFQNKWQEIRRQLPQFDVVNTHLYPANLIPLFPGKIKGPLHIFTEWSVGRNRNLSIYDKVYIRFIENADRYVAKRVDRVIAPSVYAERYIAERLGAKSRLMYLDGVDFSLFNKEATSPVAIYEKYPALRNSPVILFVGQLHPHKNVETLIRSLRIVRNKIPDTKLVIVGRIGRSADYYRYLVKLVQRESLAESVIFTGAVSWPDLPKYYAICQVYATGSLWEGFLRAEAYAMGKPMVAFDVTSNSETIRHGENGLLVKELTPEAFASALLDLLGDDKLRLQMGSNGYQWARQNLNFEVIAQNFVKFAEEAS